MLPVSDVTSSLHTIADLAAVDITLLLYTATATVVTTLSLHVVATTVAAVVISNDQIVTIMIHFNSMQTVMSII